MSPKPKINFIGGGVTQPQFIGGGVSPNPSFEVEISDLRLSFQRVLPINIMYFFIIVPPPGKCVFWPVFYRNGQLFLKLLNCCGEMTIEIIIHSEGVWRCAISNL